MTNTKHYELMVILKPDLGEKGTREALNDIRSHIGEHDGKIQFEDIWEKRTFAYPMKKYEEGYYAIFYFDMAPEHINTVKKELHLMPEVLRELFVVLPNDLDITSYIASLKKQEEIAEDEARKAREEKEKEKSKRDSSREAKAKKAAPKDAVEEISEEASKAS